MSPTINNSIIHQALGHLGAETLKRTLPNVTNINTRAIRGVGCSACPIASVHRTRFPHDSSHPERYQLWSIAALDHAQLPEPALPNGHLYIFAIVDTFSRYAESFLVRSRRARDAIPCLKRYRVTAKLLDTIRTDNASELVGREFNDYLLDEGLMHETTAPHSPEQNSIVESFIKCTLAITRAIMVQADAPLPYFGLAFLHATKLWNFITHVGQTESPYQIAFGRKPDLSLLRRCLSVVVYKLEGKSTGHMKPYGDLGILITTAHS
jgi:transposase InsO family protein